MNTVEYALRKSQKTGVPMGLNNSIFTQDKNTVSNTRNKSTFDTSKKSVPSKKTIPLLKPVDLSNKRSDSPNIIGPVNLTVARKDSADQKRFKETISL